MARIIPRIMGEAIIDRDFGSPYSPEHTSGAYTFPPPHIHFGASICSNDDKDRVKWLLLTPNALPWLSVEPFLGPVDDVPLEGIGWIVAGGESGPGARPLDPAWVRDLRDRANALGIPFFFKQWGGERNKRGGDDAVLDGKRWTQFPTTLSS
jgi:protein gp37